MGRESDAYQYGSGYHSSSHAPPRFLALTDGDFQRGVLLSHARERRRDLDVSSRVLSELASREAALDAQIEAAREDARREVEAAEAEAARILAAAQARVQALQAEHEQQLEAETRRIREEARLRAEEDRQATRARAHTRVQQAAEYILRAVLP